jgi:hypothetical protein
MQNTGQYVNLQVERSQPQPQAALPFADDGDLDGRQVAQFFRELGEGLEGVVSSSAKAKRGRGKNKNATPLRDKLHKNWGGKVSGGNAHEIGSVQCPCM